MEYVGKKIKTDGRKFLLDVLKLIGVSGRDRFPNYVNLFINMNNNNNNILHFLVISSK
jgi:hypothetical protein